MLLVDPLLPAAETSLYPTFLELFDYGAQCLTPEFMVDTLVMLMVPSAEEYSLLKALESNVLERFIVIYSFCKIIIVKLQT